MKVLVNCRFLTQPVTGVQRYAIECSLQIKRLCPNAIFVSPPGIVHQHLANQLKAVVTGRNSGHIWEQVDLPLFARKHGSPPLLNMANTAPLLYANNYITLHDLAFHYHPEWNSKWFAIWYNFMVPRIVAKAKHIFTVSETVKKEIAAVYNVPSQKLSVTYNGVPGDWQGIPRGADTKQPILLSVGTFNIRKNQANLVRGFLTSNAVKKIKLVLVGDRNKVFADTGINERDLTDNGIVIMQGLSEKELHALYRKSAIVASVSLYEGFGIPLLEGWHEGCQLLCSDIPVYRELFTPVAQFCDPLDTADIARCIDAATERYLNNQNETLTLPPEEFSFSRSAATILKAIKHNK
jgi:glycosyltransferase involved in cell wall biosynthesis